MRLFKRTVPPAATPITFGQIISGFAGILRGDRERERFRSEIKDYFGVKHCFLVSSGKAALTLILQALHQLSPDKRSVVIPAFTCYSVPSAVKRAGLELKLCDIDPRTLDFNYDQLESMLYGSQSTDILAIIPRHIFGLSADVDRLRRITHDSEISIVEDAAQTMGGGRDGKMLGTLGDAGVFSLGRGKAFSTVEGGVILTQKDDLGEMLRKQVDALPEYSVFEIMVLILKAVILSLCMRPALFWLPKSLPFLKIGATIYETRFPLKRLSAVQAGIARRWQGRLRAFMKTRSANAHHWVSCLQGVTIISKIFHGCDHRNGPCDGALVGNPVRFPAIFCDDISAREILHTSESTGLGVMITYPDSVAGIPELAMGFDEQEFPVAREYAKRMLTFPTHSYVTAKDRSRIADSLKMMQV
jgi:perosamine synthetase